MFSKTLLVGNLTKDADHTAGDEGGKSSRVLVTIATDAFWYAGGERKQKTDFHRVVAFGPQADRAQEFKKGQPVLVEGRNQTRQFEKNGETRYITEVVADRIEGLGSKPAAEPAPEPESSES